jgi:hypothetical protein
VLSFALLGALCVAAWADSYLAMNQLMVLHMALWADVLAEHIWTRSPGTCVHIQPTE